MTYQLSYNQIDLSTCNLTPRNAIGKQSSGDRLCGKRGFLNRKEYNRKYKKSFIGKFNQARAMAKWRDLEFDIDFKAYKELIKQPCFYCAKKSSGLDRIKNNKGYNLKNVLPCCRSCNVLRNDQFSVEETQVMVKALLKFRSKK